MSITDELREYAQRYKNSHDAWSGIGDDLDKIADSIDIAHKHAIGYVDDRDPETMAENGWLKLPVDADGVPIRLGDEMECGDGTVFTVENITLYTFGWRCDGDGIDGNGYKCTAHPIPECCRHHKPTIEDVFTEFAYKLLNHDQTDAISNRVKRYAEEYADKMHAIIEWSKGPEWQETAYQDEGR